ncbi:MAG: hypothetical protein KBT50_06935 [Cycloclasticus sp.]|nr:hypothetical protein [Cycloclasticus sp.]MBQ0790337.1 hypothetical protein [Cycloclasticus sp.]
MHRCPHPYHLTKRRRYIERGALLFVLLGLALSFIAGRFSVNSVEAYQLENDHLRQAVKQLSETHKEWNKKQDFVEAAKKINAYAEKESRLALSQLHDELSDTKEQLAFYQRVVAPETIIKGLHVSSFEISAINETGEYQYELIIAQGASQKRAIKGRYSLSIEGQLSGVETSLAFEQLTKKLFKTKGFSFRYYEILTGKIKLPQKFKPQQVNVIIQPSFKNSKPVERRWMWQEVLKRN